MPGHLFVTRGDLKALTCDAILVPSGSAPGRRGGDLEPAWTSLGITDRERDRMADAVENGRRVLRLRRKSPGGATIWLGHTGERHDEHADWYAEALREFLRESASMRLGGARVAPFGSKRKLVALPLIGTGAGGKSHDKGSVVMALVDAALTEVRTLDLDVVIVAHTAEAFAACQQARAREEDRAWDSLSVDLQDRSRSLARLARTRDLVLFLGAGVGVGAGLPTWKALIAELSEAAFPGETARHKALAAADPRDAGQILDRGLRAQNSSLVEQIGEWFDISRVSLLHQILASLPAAEAATTNYDVCFETALRAAGRPAKVLPRESAQGAKHWLLKLHGSVDDPDRVVLSREQYLRFEGDGSALTGLVQALLLTRHMLFVGYSLEEDNFHRMMHQVRATLGSADSRPRSEFATAVTPDDPGLKTDIWAGDVRFVSTHDSAERHREVAIFLDHLIAQAASPASHLLDKTYASVFSEDEKTLISTVGKLEAESRADGVRPALTEAIGEALDGIGLVRPTSAEETRDG